jgi:hypothetical protein
MSWCEKKKTPCKCHKDLNMSMKLTINMKSEACDKNRDSGEKIKGSDLREIRKYSH